MTDLQPVSMGEMHEPQCPCRVVLLGDPQPGALSVWPDIQSPVLQVRRAQFNGLPDIGEADVMVIWPGSMGAAQWQQILRERHRYGVLLAIGAENDPQLALPQVDDVLAETALPRLQSRLLLWRDWLLARHLREQWSDLQRVESLKNEFLATVHHELRTPLTSILGSLSLLNGKVAGELPPKAGVLIDMAFRNAQRLSRLIDDVLDVAKHEEERIELHRKSCEVAPMLADALAANQAFADKAAVRLELGAQIDCGAIRVDSDRFAQVLANLLSNAIKHSKAGDVVQLSASAQAGNCVISVQDRGPGIAPEFRKRLFEKFSQADGSDRRAKGGTGLGLYISRLLVQRMGGEIGVHSEPGNGACFYVSFPLEEMQRSRHE
jgi:signal transduction histidine kinase